MRSSAPRRTSRAARRPTHRPATRTSTSTGSSRMRAALLGAAEFDSIVLFARDAMLADIRNDLEEFGVRFDSWYSERELSQSGAIERALDALRASRATSTRRTAPTWFKSTDFGDDEDRVVVRANGEKTYFASDIAYHFDKRQRGHDLLIDVWGADHHGYVARVRGALMALGEPGDCFEVCAHAAGEPVPRRRKAGHGQTRRQLRDAARPAQRSRQRRLPLLLPDAQPRPGAGFRPGAGQVPLQRKPGVLHPVRARARGLGDEAARRRRATPTTPARPTSRCSTNAHEQAVLTARLEISGDHRARGAEPRAACAGAFPARPCEHAAHLLQRGDSSSSRKRPCATRA